MPVPQARFLILAEDGQDVAEYGLIVALIGLLVLGGSTSFGQQLHTWFLVLGTRIFGA